MRLLTISYRYRRSIIIIFRLFNLKLILLYLLYLWPALFFLRYYLAAVIALVILNYPPEIECLLATRSIEARARQEGRVSLYDWIVYKRGSKARERKGEERKYRSKLYTILWSRDSNLPLRNSKLRQSNGNLPVLFSTSAVTLPPPLKKPALRLYMSVLCP